MGKSQHHQRTPCFVAVAVRVFVPKATSPGYFTGRSLADSGLGGGYRRPTSHVPVPANKFSDKILKKKDWRKVLNAFIVINIYDSSDKLLASKVN